MRIISNWFTEKCKNKTININREYCFLKQWEIEKNTKQLGEENKIDIKQERNYSLAELEKSRRLLAQYYWQLYLFCKKPGHKKLIKNFFNENELNLFAIVAYMNKAVDDNDLYKNLNKKGENGGFQIIDFVPEKDSIKCLVNLYKEFENIFKVKKK